MVDQNIDDLRRLGQELIDRCKAAVEDGVIDRDENDEILTKVKEIEQMIMHDKIITKKEAAFMREVQDMLNAYLKDVPRKFD